MIDDYNKMHNVSQYQSDVVSCHHTTSAPTASLRGTQADRDYFHRHFNVAGDEQYSMALFPLVFLILTMQLNLLTKIF